MVYVHGVDGSVMKIEKTCNISLNTEESKALIKIMSVLYNNVSSGDTEGAGIGNAVNLLGTSLDKNLEIGDDGEVLYTLTKVTE